MTKLTEHFTLKEMTASANHPEVYNVPPLDVIDNIRRVCEWLEDLRRVYNLRYGNNVNTEENGNRPILINSGYRSPMLNRAVGGAAKSNHLTGSAADIRCPGKTANERAQMALRYAILLIEIAEYRNEKFDELIIERKGTNWWVHFAVKESGNSMHITCLNKSS